jgi:hypothetical protein
MELGIVDPNQTAAHPFPEAYLNTSPDPTSPPLIWNSTHNPNHSRADSIHSDLARLLPSQRRPGTGSTLASNNSGLSSRTISVNDVSSYYKDKDAKYLPDLGSRPSTPSAPLFPERKGSPVHADYCPVSAEAMVPLPRPPKDAPPPPKRKVHWFITFRLWYNTYRKFFTVAIIVNAVLFIMTLIGQFDYAKKYPGALVLGNFMATILVRNELFGRLLYLIVNTCLAKVSLELRTK